MVFLHRGSGRAASLSRVSDNDTLTLTGSTSLLDSSVLVTGAVLASTAVCTIEEIIAFNISIQEIESILGLFSIVCVYFFVDVMVSTERA